jgi:hypothetical protein
VFKLHSLNFPYFLKTTESKGEENYIYIYTERERERKREKNKYICVYIIHMKYIYVKLKCESYFCLCLALLLVFLQCFDKKENRHIHIISISCDLFFSLYFSNLSKNTVRFSSNFIEIIRSKVKYNYIQSA